MTHRSWLGIFRADPTSSRRGNLEGAASAFAKYLCRYIDPSLSHDTVVHMQYVRIEYCQASSSARHHAALMALRANPRFALFASGASESIKLATRRVQPSLFLSMKVYNNQKI